MTLTLTNKHALTPEVIAYTFSATEPLTFIPGQFALLKNPSSEPKCARAFSFASAPHKQEITFLMKHNPDGLVSGYLHESEIGAPLEIGKPTGRFILNENDASRVFIATGTGLAPIISFLEHMATTNDRTPTTVIFGVRHEHQLFWTEKLPAHSIITLSQPSEHWTGSRGRVTEYIVETLEKHTNAGWYLCGSPDMVKAVRAQLIDHNVTSSDIHFEVY